jgi:uncharacterized protein (DUF1810 family)
MMATDSGKALDRFVTAQAAQLAAVEAELRQGRKVTHWIWYVFPQLSGLGRSSQSKHYALADVDEARAYLTHPTLGPRLRHHVQLVVASERDVHAIFGHPDDLKFHSCVTLFDAVAPGEVFERALHQHFEGRRDQGTLRLLDE